MPQYAGDFVDSISLQLALDEAAREASWLQRLDAEFHPARGNKLRTIVLFEDNKPCIKQIENPCQHSKIKHIDVPLKALRQDCTDLNKFKLTYINTKCQIGDALIHKAALPASALASAQPRNEFASRFPQVRHPRRDAPLQEPTAAPSSILEN